MADTVSLARLQGVAMKSVFKNCGLLFQLYAGRRQAHATSRALFRLGCALNFPSSVERAAAAGLYASLHRL
jgi:hypothetical protein